MRILMALLLLWTGASFAADWDLDTSFAFSGRQTVPFDAGGSNTDRIVKILRYPDSLGGKYVAVGSASLPAGGIGIALARFNADGTVDNSFGANNNGRVLKDACMSNVTNAAFDSFFRIVVVGTTSCSGNASSDAAVVRFTATGADDLTFAGDGGINVKFRPSFDVNDFGGALLVLSDDSVLVGGNAAGNSAYVQKVSATGVVSNLPPAQTNPGANVQKIVDVKLGQFNSSFWLISEDDQTLNRPGAIWKINNATLANDTGFDSTGLKDIVVTSNAGIFASCGTGPEHRVSSLVRFGTRIYGVGFTNSSVSRSFMVGFGENDGTVRTYRCLEAGTTPVNFTALAAEGSGDANGSIYLAGSCGAPENFCLWRTVRSDASSTSFIPDITFNGGVPVSVSFSAGSGQAPQSNAFSMVRHSNKTVLAGLRVFNLVSGDFDFALARFGTDNPQIFKNGFEN
jgi:Domain of unknown function (DUF5122) beta-propeller